MGKYFGTDGYRGRAGVELCAHHAYKIGRFLGYKCKSSGKRGIVIGKDTRLSSYMLEYALAAGIVASGTDAYMLHVTTTPCVSYCAREGDFDLGVMISASHNPYYDNGIKIINGRGEKLSDEKTLEIEKFLDSDEELPYATDGEIGKIVDYSEGRNRYIGYLISQSQRSFKSLRVGLDGANGGGWMILKSVFDSLGAKTYTVNCEPNGTNINKNAGSTDTGSLISLVKEKSLDVGFALDGDGDRLICVDRNGCEVDGDKIIYLLTRELKGRGELLKNKVVITVMSNMGLIKSLSELGIETEITDVGDKYVYEAIKDGGYSLGGEQSGHIILSKFATTGDGILTGVKVAEAMVENKCSIDTLVSDMHKLEQKSISIKVKDKEKCFRDTVLQASYESAKIEIGDRGRVLLRVSGTEPKIRVMVEHENKDECEKIAEKLAQAVREADGGSN